MTDEQYLNNEEEKMKLLRISIIYIRNDDAIEGKRRTGTILTQLFDGSKKDAVRNCKIKRKMKLKIGIICIMLDL